MANDAASKKVVYVALAGNIAIAATKAGAAAWTGSSAMLSEAIHSFVDSGNELLLLYGMRRAARRPDREHPLGYGRELYFWSFIVALLVFALGAGVSLYEGVVHLLNAEAIQDARVNYIVLGVAFLFEGASWVVSLREFNGTKGDLGYYEAFHKSKDPVVFMVLIEDSAALLGIVIAAAGTYAADSLGYPLADGAASLLIGLMLGAISLLLARESKSLLIGERADAALADAILHLAAQDGAVLQANGVITVHLAPEQIFAALSLEFADATTAPQIEQSVADIERRIRAAHPQVVNLFVKPQTAASYRSTVQRKTGQPPERAPVRN